MAKKTYKMKLGLSDGTEREAEFEVPGLAYGITKGNMLVGNGAGEMVEKTPEEVREHIGAPGKDDPPNAHGNHVPEPEEASNARFLRNDNTWQTVTPEGIGAAPDGHGLGTNAVLKSWAEVDNIKTNGNYKFSSGVVIDGAAFGIAFMRVDNFDNNLVRQQLIPNYTTYLVIERFCMGGTWQPWEWVNPRMKPDVEYRTTERINDQPVKKRITSAGELQYSTYDGSTWSDWKSVSELLGTLSVAHGGTGATTAAQALANLGGINAATPITTGSCDNITSAMTLRDIRTDNDELYNLFYKGKTKNENYAYIITLFYSTVGAEASKVQIAIGYTHGYMATRAFYKTSGWKPWNMQMSSILHPYFYGSNLPSAGTAGRVFFKLME